MKIKGDRKQVLEHILEITKIPKKSESLPRSVQIFFDLGKKCKHLRNEVARPCIAGDPPGWGSREGQEQKQLPPASALRVAGDTCLFHSQFCWLFSHFPPLLPFLHRLPFFLCFLSWGVPDHNDLAVTLTYSLNLAGGVLD